MAEALAFLNGRWISPAELSVPVWDTGFVQGVTVAEQLRTFGGKLFRLDLHLERLANSLRLIGLDLEVIAKVHEHASHLVAHNHRLLETGSDLGLSIFVTPGPYAGFAPPGLQGPTLGMHTYPVAFGSFADKYLNGERLATTDITQVPTTCWPAALKCRSRMHYYLADRHAKLVDPLARALMMDQEGFVTEASTANLVLYRADTGFISPPREKILPGVSVSTLEQLGKELNIPFVLRDITPDDVFDADEALLCSTSPCLVPVVALNNQRIGVGRPGTIFQQAIHAWSQLVGLDIVGQAQRFSSGKSLPAGEL